MVEKLRVDVMIKTLRHYSVALTLKKEATNSFERQQ
jgi:hypothetical protein